VLRSTNYHPTSNNSSTSTTMRRRMNKAHRDRAVEPSPLSYAPTPGPSQRHHLSKSKPAPHRPLVYLADGETLTQDYPLPRLPGQVGFAGDRPQDGLMLVPRQPPHIDNHDGANLGYDYDSPFQSNQDNPVDPARSRHRKKRVTQWRRWDIEIIPALINTYIKLLAATNSLRNDPPPPSKKACTCGDIGRNLAVTVVKFTGNFPSFVFQTSTNNP
jgi:hypothetical protein